MIPSRRAFLAGAGAGAALLAGQANAVSRTVLSPVLLGAARWTPSQLGAVLVAWWDASQGVTQSGGAAVSAWADRVGSISVVQATGSLQPIYSATSLNGSAGITFDGVDDMLVIAPVPAVLPTGTANGWAFGLASQDYTTAQRATGSELVSYGGSTSSNARELFRIVNGGVNRAGADSGATTVVNTVVDDSGIHAIFGQYIGSTSVGGTVDGNSFGPIARTVNTGTTNLKISGWTGSTGFNWKGAVGHVLIGTGQLSTSNRQKLEGWALWSCGKQANLPAGHPYVSFPPTVGA